MHSKPPCMRVRNVCCRSINRVAGGQTHNHTLCDPIILPFFYVTSRQECPFNNLFSPPHSTPWLPLTNIQSIIYIVIFPPGYSWLSLHSRMWNKTMCVTIFDNNKCWCRARQQKKKSVTNIISPIWHPHSAMESPLKRGAWQPTLTFYFTLLNFHANIYIVVIYLNFPPCLVELWIQ